MVAGDLILAIVFPYHTNFRSFSPHCIQVACRMDLYSQAHNLGILTEFVDGQGQRHVTDQAALRIIVDSLPAGSAWRFVEGTVVIRSGRPARTSLTAAVKAPLRWQIVAGQETVAEGESRDDKIDWPDDLPVGAYRILLTDSSKSQETVPLIVAPPSAFGGDFDRGWLLAVQLYGVRSARNWGIGDFSDLEALIRACRTTRRRRRRPQPAACVVRRPAW